MIAGYGTTASTLSFAIHILLNHPEELEKLREEIDSLVCALMIYSKISIIHYNLLFNLFKPGSSQL